MTRARRSNRGAWLILPVAAGLAWWASWLFHEPRAVLPEVAAAGPQAASTAHAAVRETRVNLAKAAPDEAVHEPALGIGVARPSPEGRVTAATHTSSAVTDAFEPERQDLHPHPITPERVALQRELQLIAALNDALDLRDAASMRSILADYRAHDPRDQNELQAGYARLIDCIEAPGDASRAAAQTYYETYRASTLRRFIRLICLE